MRHVEIDLGFGRTLKASMTPPDFDVSVNINLCTRSPLPNGCSPTDFGLPGTPCCDIYGTQIIELDPIPCGGDPKPDVRFPISAEHKVGGVGYTEEPPQGSQPLARIVEASAPALS